MVGLAFWSRSRGCFGLDRRRGWGDGVLAIVALGALEKVRLGYRKGVWLWVDGWM